MAELAPAPLEALIRRVFAEAERQQSVFDLPRRSWYQPNEELDLSVRFHGERAGTPVGPAAGPHTQMAQNILLSWLAGSRILELKTVQINDQLEIPRPCIDVHTIGYNVEWSQELRLGQSLDEYVKAWILIHMVARSDVLEWSHPLATRELAGTLFDLSVGYDLAGIQSPEVTGFIRGCLDTRETAARLLAEVPAPWAHLVEEPIPTTLSSCITLSTFHGCPAGEIESIARYLLDHIGVHVIIKLNPTLLGYEQARQIVCEDLGYEHLVLPRAAFDEDLQWQQMVDMVERLSEHAHSLGLTLGVKLTNTLIVENHGSFFDTETMYLSGQPLHVLSIQLHARIRAQFPTLPISFSAGVDRINFPSCVALGLIPVTTCTDLLRPGGYARLPKYLKNLEKQMKSLEVTDVAGFIAAKALDPAAYAQEVLADERYHAHRNANAPKQIDSTLVTFDCINCDKCVPVCPNDANFVYMLSAGQFPAPVAVWDGANLALEDAPPIVIEKEHQLANFADFCNECGNCDVFCPEEGGPYIVKPRFFGSREEWEKFPTHDGLAFGPGDDGAIRVWARLLGDVFEGSLSDGKLTADDGILQIVVGTEAPFAIEARPPSGGDPAHRRDLRPVVLAAIISGAVLDTDLPSPVNAPFL